MNPTDAGAARDEHLPDAEWLARTPEETFEVGREVGARLLGGEILLLHGPLGAGKTVFVKGLADALGIDTDEVTSPSFTLVNPYTDGRLTLYHLDLYRLDEGAGAAHAVGLEDLLADEQALIVIEWGERLGAYRFPTACWHISIEGDGEDPRRITLAGA